MARLDPQSLPQHVDRLYRAAWALCGSPHDAEDLVQETFARVLARPRLLRGQDELAYLMRVLRNTFLTQRRTAGRRPQNARVTLDDIEFADPRTGDRPDEALQAKAVFGAISALPDNYRLALVAVDVVGLSYREAAKALGTREATIATRVFRGRERVAREMSGESAKQDGPAAQDGRAARESARPALKSPTESGTTAVEPGGDPRGQPHSTSREAPGPHGSLV